MDNSVGRRQVLSGAAAALLVTALEGCRAGLLKSTRAAAPLSPRLQMPPLHASTDRITRITVCTRPFRAQGPRLDVERIGTKTIVHNYGHGGSGWSLSWGSSSIAVHKAMATGERRIAVIGCGALGLTSGLLLQRAGADVTIYAKGNATGYGARALLDDQSVIPVRGQLARMIPQTDIHYGLFYKDVSFVPRRDGLVFQVVGDTDYYGFDDDTTMPNRAEADYAVNTIAGLFA